ncbi:hypothetical protein [Marinilabilia salmonicolor]|jgi:predicted RND superfamily exporter protein|uniref:Uncharacterized protein n=1 Tax=Marinilabilia salmonicolor TaxID=989 RepID=A0A2T0XQX7_9BACT|nr:hypothetical protein [Marinilabilia salmonicolor]PRZ01323.1 hypothetical protein BY457_103138 [Marinilabilia salmonicolor]RCW39279.1 hypothetical protein DFO77_10147 [Marinilabilia salmonicolor]
MDGIGEIIYIIIMVVIFIFSALKRKKPERNDMPVPEDQESRSPFDEVFSPFKEIFEDEEPIPQERPQKQQSEEEPAAVDKARKSLKGAPFVKEDYVFTANASPTDSRRQRKNQSPGRQENLKSEESGSLGVKKEVHNNLNDWFDLKEAVIYSEILKRPDY